MPDNRYAALAFWLLWVLANAVGWGVGGPVGVELESIGDPSGSLTSLSTPSIIMAGYLGVAVGGILTAALQWVVLRGQVRRAARWIAASVVAAAAVGVVVFAVGAVDADVGWVLGAGSFGTFVGVLQWLMLRRQFTGAGWWILASTAGWVVALPVGGFFGWAALGTVYGVVTGSHLLWLLLRKRMS